MTNDNYAEDEYGHSMHVKGIIANNDSAPSGYEGVAPEVELAVIKSGGMPGPHGNYNQQIYDAIKYVDAQVISMSMCFRDDDNKCIKNSDGTTKWEHTAD